MLLTHEASVGGVVVIEVQPLLLNALDGVESCLLLGERIAVGSLVVGVEIKLDDRREAEVERADGKQPYAAVEQHVISEMKRALA